MVKLYNNVVRTRVKGYGAISHLPVVFRENDFGQLKGQLLKMNPSRLAQQAVPTVKEGLRQLAPKVPEIVDAGREIMEVGREMADSAMEESGRISQKAEKLLKKMASKTKKITKKLKNVKIPKDFPKAISSKLSKKQKEKLNKMAQSTLTNLLKRGSGLKLM
jgi:hypothetical protein